VLLAMWVDSMRPGELVVRSVALDGAGMAWTAPVRLGLSEQVPPVSRLLATWVDDKLYVLWTVPTRASVELHGGILMMPLGAASAPATGAAQALPTFTWMNGRLKPMSLGVAGRGISPEYDVAVGGSENALVAVVATKEGATLASFTFSEHGDLESGPITIEPKSIARDLQIGQNIGMLLLVLVMSLSLWQWWQKAETVALPAGMVEAPLHLRAIAFVIDAAIPFVGVLAAFGELGNSATVFSTWMSNVGRPDELLRMPEFLIFLGVYLVLCCCGEFLFRRTIGKAVVGLQVRMADGRSPTVAAVLLRNLVRLPETALGLIILYLLISDHKQRLGDMLGRTVVVAAEPPEVPEDGGGEE
jgi:uncharacterized RDD family membrane protein YckC